MRWGRFHMTPIRALLISAGVDPDIADLILGAAEKAKIFMGGAWGVLIAMTIFSAGMAQGCPLSALVLCLTIQLRIAIVTALKPPSDSPAGVLSHLSHIDYVTFTPPTVPALRTTAVRLPVAGGQTHLHSAPLKAKGLVVRKVGTQYKFDDPGIVMGGGFLCMATADQYIRVVGRHALPHVFHREDYIKLMMSCRRAAIAMRCEKLPANYPILMYSAARGGDATVDGCSPAPCLWHLARMRPTGRFSPACCHWVARDRLSADLPARASRMGWHRTCYRGHGGTFYAHLHQTVRA